MAETPEQIAALTDAAAAGPASVTVDGHTVAAQPLAALIALEQHRAEQAAARSATLGIRLFRTIPPGST